MKCLKHESRCVSSKLLFVAVLAASATVRAACNDAEAPLLAPTAGVEMRLSPSNAEKVTYRLPRITEDRRVSLPGIVPDASLVRNRGFDQDGGQIIYLESDGIGGSLHTRRGASLHVSRRGRTFECCRCAVQWHWWLHTCAQLSASHRERDL